MTAGMSASGAPMPEWLDPGVQPAGTDRVRPATNRRHQAVVIGHRIDRRRGDRSTVLLGAVRELCHDMRQPAATIGALAEAALTAPSLDDSVAQRLRHILAEVRLLADLIQRMTDPDPLKVPVNPGTLLAEAVDEMAVTYAGVIRVRVEARPPLVADPVALRRALSNALVNAARAAGPLGVVLVVITGGDGWTAFEIGDSGPGFGAAPPGAASLGLFIAERVVKAHGGRLEIARSELGGALVRLVLPTAPPQLALAEETARDETTAL
jgi:signal transduction histidine kinase